MADKEKAERNMKGLANHMNSGDKDIMRLPGEGFMRPVFYGAFWIGVYLVVSAAPLFVMLIGSTPPGRGFWMEFSVGIGFAALSMMGLQFFLTGRFRAITSPYGIDVVYHFHRNISLIILLFLVLHPAILLISNPPGIFSHTARIGIRRPSGLFRHCFDIALQDNTRSSV